MKHITWLMLAVIILLSLFQSQEIFYLNTYSLQVVEASVNTITIPNTIDQTWSFSDPTINCHARWLSLLPALISTGIGQNLPAVEEVMQCSLINTYFIRIFAPQNMQLASSAARYYPGDPGILFWLADGIEKEDPERAEQLFRKIVDLQPNNGRAWHRLGRLVEQLGLIDEAISYYHNSCVNMDPGNHGCYNAGRLLEQEGRYEEAIYYYSLSRLDYIRVNAERLEAELEEEFTK